jgi:hypothetical protein
MKIMLNVEKNDYHRKCFDLIVDINVVRENR